MGEPKGMLPSAPLKALIRRRALEFGGIKELARRVSFRTGKSYAACYKQLERLLQREKVVLETADEYTIAMGEAPECLWPEEFLALHM